MSEEKKDHQEYVPFFKRQEEIRADTQRKKLEKKKSTSSMNEDQANWAKATISLQTNESFKKYIWLESMMTADSLRMAFTPRAPGTVVPKDCDATKKTYGEMMAYNEGYYHGLLRMKSEREKIWMEFLKFQEGGE